MDESKKIKTTDESLLANLKIKFFAQYFGQTLLNPYSLLTYTNTGILKEINPVQLSGIIENDFIELKSLSNYTKEDSIEVERIWRASDIRVEAYFKNSYPNTVHDNRELVGRSLIKYWLEEDKLNFQNRIDYRTIQHITDYLRSKGYALPFMEYSVNDLVSLGWVQLI